MWIVTQDNKRIVDVSDFNIIEVKTDECRLLTDKEKETIAKVAPHSILLQAHRMINIKNFSINDLGIYSTEEQAKDVLDQIRLHIIKQYTNSIEPIDRIFKMPPNQGYDYALNKKKADE